MLLPQLVRTVIVGTALQLTAPIALGQCTSSTQGVVHYRPKPVIENVLSSGISTTVVSTIAVKATSQLIATAAQPSIATAAQVSTTQKAAVLKSNLPDTQTNTAEAKVDEPVQAVEVPLIETNEELEVDVRFAGEVFGQVFLKAGRFETELDVVSWSPELIRFETPDLNILKELPVTISVHRPDGFLVRSFEALLIRKQTIRRIAKTVASTRDSSQDAQQ